VQVTASEDRVLRDGKQVIQIGTLDDIKTFVDDREKHRVRGSTAYAAAGGGAKLAGGRKQTKALFIKLMKKHAVEGP